ncbi:DsrE family protein [Thiobacillus sp.]
MRQTLFALTFTLTAALWLASPGAFAASAPEAQGQLAPGAKKDKLIIQVSDKDPGKWNLALSNARNVQAALGPDKVDIEIVAYGPGIAMLTMDSEVANGIARAIGDGVKIVACQNTMKGVQLQEADMLPDIGYAQSGVAEIMHRQQTGYSYVRP